MQHDLSVADREPVHSAVATGVGEADGFKPLPCRLYIWVEEHDVVKVLDHAVTPLPAVLPGSVHRWPQAAPPRGVALNKLLGRQSVLCIGSSFRRTQMVPQAVCQTMEHPGSARQIEEVRIVRCAELLVHLAFRPCSRRHCLDRVTTAIEISRRTSNKGPRQTVHRSRKPSRLCEGSNRLKRSLAPSSSTRALHPSN